MQSDAKVFHYRLDLYWRSTAIYALVLLLYGVGRSLVAGTLQSDGKIEVVVADPLFWLLVLIVAASAVSLVINLALQRRLVITSDALIFATRLGERRVPRSEIRRVVVRREGGRWRRLRSILIYRRGRRLPLRIRPGFYERERELTEALTSLRPSGSASATHAA